MYVHALEDFKIPGLLPRDASSREALRSKTLLTRTPDLPTVQRLAPPSHVTPGPFTTEDASSADMDMLLGSADESDVFPPPDRTRSTTNARKTGGDAASASALLRNSTALQERLAAQMAGQLQRNVGHFSGALTADQGVLRVAEEKWLQNHRGKTLGMKCLTVSRVVVVVAIAFLAVFFVIRFT
ncbi:hypothetical protein EDB86DRAFT_2829599 [Lactarius hatsudake]|nr:hypothetical protein EDB86DRAFT_2829599 [Lactarius hatsudake]